MKTIRTTAKTTMKKAKKQSGFSTSHPVIHSHIAVPKAIADRIFPSDGGILILENNSEAYNAGDFIEDFDVVEDCIGSLDTLHDICKKRYEITYVYSGRGIEPGYVLVQFHECGRKVKN